ncbi:MAG: glutamine amidotransferase [Thermomicrobiales bacterium]
MTMDLRIGWLYGHEMNIYGDRGNVLALLHRARGRGLEAEADVIGVGDTFDLDRYDILFWGGGQDREQITVSADLQGQKGRDLKAAVEDGVPMLAICGGYQLLGDGYRPYEGDKLPGIGALDVTSEAGPTRFIGNVVVDSPEFGDLVGFENHSGLTFLGPGVDPLGRTRVGHGNNGRDGFEGARYRNTIGCYMHGALLPKNPRVTDWLIAKAVQRRGTSGELPPLRDHIESAAHGAVVKRALQLGR